MLRNWVIPKLRRLKSPRVKKREINWNILTPSISGNIPPKKTGSATAVATRTSIAKRAQTHNSPSIWLFLSMMILRIGLKIPWNKLKMSMMRFRPRKICWHSEIKSIRLVKRLPWGATSSNLSSRKRVTSLPTLLLTFTNWSWQI